MALIEELAGNLIGQGARNIAILNTGVSTEAPLRIACRAILERHGVPVPCAGIRDLGRASERLLEQKIGGHADEAETSIMLALHPERVAFSRAVVDYGQSDRAPAGVFHCPGTMTGSRQGAFGDPTLASAEKGKAILAAMVEDLVKGLKASFPETLAAGRN